MSLLWGRCDCPRDICSVSAHLSPRNHFGINLPSKLSSFMLVRRRHAKCQRCQVIDSLICISSSSLTPEWSCVSNYWNHQQFVALMEADCITVIQRAAQLSIYTFSVRISIPSNFLSEALKKILTFCIHRNRFNFFLSFFRFSSVNAWETYDFPLLPPFTYFTLWYAFNKLGEMFTKES